MTASLGDVVSESFGVGVVESVVFFELSVVSPPTSSTTKHVMTRAIRAKYAEKKEVHVVFDGQTSPV